MKNLLTPVLLLLALTFAMNCSSQASSQEDEYIFFKRVNEPNEGAFSVLVPQGWQTNGGIFRLDPSAIGGAGNALAAKYDFAVFNNSSADVQIRWLPDYLFMDMRNTPAAGMFPAGSNYNGMEVRPKTDALSFIAQVVIPYAHPEASNVNLTGNKSLPGIAKAYSDYAAENPVLTMQYDAALVTLEYTENGRQYEEMIVAVVEDWGQIGAGLWGNKSCLFARAPKGGLEAWMAVLETIHTSVVINTTWLRKEIEGQGVRGGIMVDVQRQVQNLDREIAAHQQKVNYEIHNDMYLTLTDQEEYINPYTQEVEIGTNQWQNRWQNDLGEIIYTDEEDYNPNHDPDLQVSGFKRSGIRKR